MTKIELREQLISRIQITENQEILEWVLGLLSQESNQSEIYDLNFEQVAAIERAEAQFKRGEYFSEEEVDKITDEWLKG